MSGDTPDIVLNEFGDLSRKARRELLAKGIDPDTAVLEYVRTASIQVIPEESVEAPAASESVTTSAQAEEKQVETVANVAATDAPVENSMESSIPESALDVSTTTAEVFPASMSKRDIRRLLKRNKPTETVVAGLVAEEVLDVQDDSAVEEDGVDSEASGPVAAPVAVSAAAAISVAAIDSNVDEDAVAEDSASSTSSSDPDESDVIEDDVVEDEIADEAPQTIAEATAAIALAEESSSSTTVALNEDDIEPFSDTTTSTGIIATSSHALIIPTLPEETGSIAPVVPTGEILITGSILLPSSIAQVGADIEHLDTSEVDIIADDQEIAANQDLAPVSATTAVSSYNTSNTVQTVPRRLNDRLPFILSITAAGLAVAVVGLFIAGSILGLF